MLLCVCMFSEAAGVHQRAAASSLLINAKRLISMTVKHAGAISGFARQRL